MRYCGRLCRFARHELFDLRQLEENHRCDHREDQLWQHVCAVVAQRVKPRMSDPRRTEGDEFLKVREDNRAGYEVAHKAEKHREACAEADACIALAAERTRETDDGIRHDVVKQNRTDKAGRRQAPAEHAVHRDAERELDHGLHERCRETPLQPEHDGNHGAWQHGKQRNRAAKGHFQHLNQAEHRAERDHDRAYGELVCIAVLLHLRSFPQYGFIKRDA